MWWVINATPPAVLPPGREPVLIVQESGWAPGPVWTGAEYPAPSGFRSLDRPARIDYAIPTHDVLFNRTI
jgi:hypothetical protein